MNEMVLISMLARLDAQEIQLAAMGAAFEELLVEIRRANDIHTRALEGLQAVLRDRGDDEWWKGGKSDV